MEELPEAGSRRPWACRWWGERWLPGGIDRSNHVVTLADGREFVLRRWTRPNWRMTDPGFDVAREATALTLLERAGARTPRLIRTCGSI